MPRRSPSPWPQGTSRFTPPSASFCPFISSRGTRRPEDTPPGCWSRTPPVRFSFSPELGFQAASLKPVSSADSDISDFVHNLESQDIRVEAMRQSDYMSAAPHSAAFNVTGSSKVRTFGLGSGAGNDAHSLPLLLAGLQIHHRLQQHHGPLSAHGRQPPEQRSAQGTQWFRPDPNLDQTL